jgi:Ser/Thr protein kinase RdoA (MazF antagonist)
LTHSDTKINNLIFAEDFSKVNAVIDLDTLMAGYVYYDFGDLVRTVACTEGESSQDWEKIKVDAAKYNALLEGIFRSGKRCFY